MNGSGDNLEEDGGPEGGLYFRVFGVEVVVVREIVGDPLGEDEGAEDGGDVPEGPETVGGQRDGRGGDGAEHADQRAVLQNGHGHVHREHDPQFGHLVRHPQLFAPSVHTVRSRVRAPVHAPQPHLFRPFQKLQRVSA